MSTVKWSERSVHGRGLLLRTVILIVVLVCVASAWDHPALLLVGLLLGVPLTIVYYAITCPRCDAYLIHPLQGSREPVVCPRCALPTRQPWQKGRGPTLVRR